MPSADGLRARRAALQILDRVLRGGETMAAASSSAQVLAANDRALALAIAGEVFRRLPDLDSWIDSATKTPLPGDSKARAVLRMALAQKVGLGTPDHAIVATALPLVDGGPRRLVHGVLGNLLRGKIPRMDPPHLDALVEQRWTVNWGVDVVAAARRQIASRPALDLSFKNDDAAIAFAAANQGQVTAPRSVRIASANVTGLAGFEAGDWWVQDLAASLPARLIPATAKRVTDLCAAPGGKTMQLAAAGHDVVALDLSEERLGRLRENLRRTGLRANTVAADVLNWRPEGSADAILLDAPCSATGTFRRHPEVLVRAGPRAIAQMAEFQARLLNHAATLVASGGPLVYATCSLEPAEGEDVVRAFIDSHPGWRVDPPAAHELPEFVSVSKEGWVRCLPGDIEAKGGLDGFFFARLVAKG